MNSVATRPQPLLVEVRGRPVRLLHSLPTLIVLLMLGGIAVWGHHTDWNVRQFFLRSNAGKAPEDDWCEAHSVPQSQCIECQDALSPKKEVAWCKVHGVAECLFEHPELAQLKEKPQILPADVDRAARALALIDRPTNYSRCKHHLRRIQFASKRAFDKTGVSVLPVARGRVVESVSANGEITYDPTRVARVSARAAGAVWQVNKQVGDPVQKGELLALVDAAEAGKAKAEFLQARVQLDLKKKMLESMRLTGTTTIPEYRLREAETAVQEAQIRLVTARQWLVNLGLPLRTDEFKDNRPEEIADKLQFLGLPSDLTNQLDAQTTTANFLPIKSPLEGIVTVREVVAGEIVDTTKVLFIVADIDRMWLTLSVRAEDARLVRLGQSVIFRTEGSKEDATGKINWISTSIDKKTRTIKVRAELDNKSRRLRDHTFGTGKVILREETDAIVVPNEAVHWEGCCQVVFVRDRDYDPANPDNGLVFHVRKVRLGAKDDKQTEIIAGLLPNEVIAVRGSGSLRAELLKNQIGEGCADCKK